ncbi:MAG: hypothetical protein PHX60_15955, partial [Giesbergeria sp.]|uniref:hypothetical protein n=1 Tax=Giesbergeria sp. TaxID=2818473 RepID=UPI0026245053
AMGSHLLLRLEGTSPVPTTPTAQYATADRAYIPFSHVSKDQELSWSLSEVLAPGEVSYLHPTLMDLAPELTKPEGARLNRAKLS